ncbi:MAG: hypothetical protein MUO64_01065 [Anaerolineales bacterium]|nr:hypothetical protein [Anaerolineales bacterium]
MKRLTWITRLSLRLRMVHIIFLEERKQRVAAQAGCMKDMGYKVICFGFLDKWDSTISRYKTIFEEVYNEDYS